MAASHLGIKCAQKSSLDFGCGVGRLIIPFARVFEHVTGVDISPAMLEIAQRNCLEQGIHNVEFVRSDDELSRVYEVELTCYIPTLSCSIFRAGAAKGLSYNCSIA